MTAFSGAHGPEYATVTFYDADRGFLEAHTFQVQHLAVTKLRIPAGAIYVTMAPAKESGR